MNHGPVVLRTYYSVAAALSRAEFGVLQGGRGGKASGERSADEVACPGRGRPSPCARHSLRWVSGPGSVKPIARRRPPGDLGPSYVGVSAVNEP